MQFLRNNKLFLILAVPALVFFIWAQMAGFRLFRSEGGNSWAPKGSNGSVHHK